MDNLQCIHAPGICSKCINERVAKALGDFEFVPASNGSDAYWKRKSYPQFPFLPNFSGSIEAAWEIVDYCVRRNLKFNLGHISRRSQWLVQISGTPSFYFAEQADTAPMAICLSFLKLKEGERDKSE